MCVTVKNQKVKWKPVHNDVLEREEAQTKTFFTVVLLSVTFFKSSASVLLASYGYMHCGLGPF